MLNAIDGVMLLCMFDTREFTETEKKTGPLLPHGSFAITHVSDTQRQGMQIEIPIFVDIEFPKVPKFPPKSETICAPVVEKIIVLFVGSRKGAFR